MTALRDNRILREAQFDPKLKFYWWIQGCIVFFATIIGIPLLPIWMLGFGQYVCHRSYVHRKCVLTDRELHVRRGYIFRVEKDIPLDKIQDLAMHEGPLLRRLGLASLRVETAGSSGGQGRPDVSLTGIVDAPAFRDAVLEQRDRVVGVASPAAPAVGAGTGNGTDALLVEIRDGLRRIEQLLERRS